MGIYDFFDRNVIYKLSGGFKWPSGSTFWIILSALFIITSCSISYFSLFGDWRTYVFGVRYQKIWDPSSAYLATGISFFDERYTSWVGHPGLFLMLLIQLIARLYYWLGSICPGTSVSYYSFLAKNLFGLIFFTKLVMTIINLLSFYVLYSLALKLLRDKWLALNSVIAYATTYTVLYYINFIVPEPLLLLFTLLSINCVWKFYENFEQESKVRGNIYLVLSSFLVVAAFFTKMTIIFPLIIFVPTFLLLQKKSLSGRYFISLRERIVSAFTFVSVGIPFMVLCSYKVDWNKFIQFWFKYSPGSLSFDSSKSCLSNVGVNSLEFLEKLIQISFQRTLSSHFLFSNNKTILFIIAELIFFICSIIGLVQYYSKFKDKRIYVYWLIFLIVTISPVVFYKWSFHYFIIHLAVASMFFSYFINNIIGRKLSSKLNKPLVALIITLVIHLGSITLFLDAKRFDIVEYQRNWKPYYKALSMIDYDGKIGVLRGISPYSVSGRMFRYFPKKSRAFQAEFSKFFVPVDDSFTEAELQKQNIQVMLERTSERIRLTKVLD